MAILYYQLDQAIDPGTGAETINRDLPRQGVTKALIFGLRAQESASSVSVTRTQLNAQLDQIRIGAVESNRVSEIDGEDLDEFNVSLGQHNLFDAASGANNAQQIGGSTYPLDPFMIGPYMDYNQGFGIGGNVARKVEMAFAADANDIDGKRVNLGIIVNTSQGSSGGYLTFHINTMQTTADLIDFFDIPQPGRLLGIFQFETTGAADVTVDGAFETDQTIEEESITVNRKVQLGPMFTTQFSALNGQYETGARTDEGYSWWDLGIRNSGRLGLPQASDIPSNMEVKVKRGDATDAGRVYPVILNTNT